MNRRSGSHGAAMVTLLLVAVALLATVRPAVAEVRSSRGQTVYVPVYSNVFTGPKANPFNLATTLSIRNTDPANPLIVVAIDYHDTAGKQVRRYLNSPISLNPLASTYSYLEEKDTAGGFGAKFMVRWEASRMVNAPIIECLMIGATSGQGISFVSPGQVIREDVR